MTGADRGRMGRPTMASFEEFWHARLQHDPALLVVPDFGGKYGRPRQGFESEECCVEEDHLRAGKLAMLNWESAKQLGLLLLDSARDFAHPSWASRRYQRECRRVETDELLKHMASYRDDELGTFTLVKSDWCVAAQDLPGYDPRLLLGHVRRKLPQRLLMSARSWLWAQIHGEYDSRTNCFQLHLHGVCTVDYKPHLAAMVEDCDRAAIWQPSRFETVNWADRARQLSYLMQSFWPHRATFIREDGKILRTRRKGRIPEPAGSIALLWLHRQIRSSMQLRVGLGSGSVWACTRMSAEKPSYAL